MGVSCFWSVDGVGLVVSTLVSRIYFSVLIHRRIIMFKSCLIISLILTIAYCQNRLSGYSHDAVGDTGLPYVHDATGDFGPYKLYKWRQQQKLAAEEANKEVILPDPTSAPKKTVVVVRKQKIKTAPLQIIRPAFESFPSRQEQQQQTRVQPTRQQQRVQPTRQQPIVFRQPEPVVPAITNPQPLTPQRVPQTPQFISQATGLSHQSSFAQRSYSYTAPTYNTQAQGVSFSYEALF